MRTKDMVQRFAYTGWVNNDIYPEVIGLIGVSQEL